jgi:peptidoglycan/LPS O-acetylase OafA/YrhL
VAVVAVLLFHGDLGIAPGGFLGVDVFFVISGFLITTLLLREHAATGGVSLVAFWRRRARRLLPALFFLLVGVLAFAAAFVPDALARLRVDVVAALGYVTNWYLLVDHQSYFEAVGRPSLLRHLWSLAVEEQFYLVWPVVLVGALWLVRRRGAVVLTLLIAAASVAWTAALVDPGGDPSRVYYGTDTRLFQLLIGALLAFLWTSHAPGRVAVWRSSLAWARGADIVALTGVVVLGWAFFFVDQYDPALYPWGAVGVALAAAVTIAAAIQPSGFIGRRILDLAPIRWLGRRSYAIYLWHWPVFVLTRPDLDVPLTPIADFALRVAITLVLAEVSWQLVESPIRRGALAGLGWRARQFVRGSAWARAGALASVATLIVAVAAVSGRVIEAPAASPPPAEILPGASFQGVVGASPEPSPPLTAVGLPDPTDSPAPSDSPVRPADAVTSPSPTLTMPSSALPSLATPVYSAFPSFVPSAAVDPSTPVASPTVDPTAAAPSASVAPSLPVVTAPPATPAPSPEPTQQPRPTPPPATPAPLNADVYAIGDSVLLGAAPELGHALGRVEVDAVIGRQMNAALGILHDRRAAGTLPGIVVVHVGNNGPITTNQVRELFDTLSSVPHVAVLTIRIPEDYESHNNKLISQIARDYPNVILVDWFAASNDRPGLFWKDGEHLRPEGADVYAALIADALHQHGVATR